MTRQDPAADHREAELKPPFPRRGTTGAGAVSSCRCVRLQKAARQQGLRTVRGLVIKQSGDKALRLIGRNLQRQMGLAQNIKGRLKWRTAEN